MVTDAKGATRSAVTNEVGNFYIAADRWSPSYPLFVELDDPRADEGGVKKMVTRIGRQGGWAFCHYGSDDEPTHTPPVFLRQKAL